MKKVINSQSHKGKCDLCFVHTYLYLIEVLSCFKGYYIVRRDSNYGFVSRVFSFVKGQCCFSWHHLYEAIAQWYCFC